MTTTTPAIGTRVLHPSSDKDDPLWGTVRRPSERQRMIGEAEYGTDLDGAVLVRWDGGSLQWEYAEDLRTAAAI